MDPISNVDRLVMILRQRLEERTRAFPTGAPQTAPAAKDSSKSNVESLRALARVQEIDERQIKRALIQNLLAEKLGPNLINDAKFQQVVGQVTDALDNEPATAELMGRLVTALRAAAS